MFFFFVHSLCPLCLCVCVCVCARARERARARECVRARADARLCVFVGPHVRRGQGKLTQWWGEAGLNRKPVIFFGEPGLNKDNMAALCHFGSPQGKRRMVSVSCERLDRSGSDLFGSGAKQGILFYIKDGTVLLNNVHQVALPPPAVSSDLSLPSCLFSPFRPMFPSFLLPSGPSLSLFLVLYLSCASTRRVSIFLSYSS
jgi:hypothetical protein